MSAFIEAEKSYPLHYCSPSGLNSCSRCMARYFFSHVLRLVPREKLRIALDYGSCMHCAVPFAYMNPAEAIRVFSLEWDKLTYGDEDSKRNTSRALASLTEFSRVRNPELCPYEVLDPPSGVVESKERYSEFEAPFLLDIGAKLPLYGKIDRFVRWKQDKSIWVLDYKTSSEVSARVFDNLEISVQSLAYTLAGSHLMGEKLSGMILELIRTSKTNAEVMCNPLFVKEHWLETFVQWAGNRIEEICESNLDRSWEKNPAACAPYGQFGLPGYVCEFKMLCDLKDWRDGAKFYAIEEWDPLGLEKPKCEKG